MTLRRCTQQVPYQWNQQHVKSDAGQVSSYIQQGEVSVGNKILDEFQGQAIAKQGAHLPPAEFDFGPACVAQKAKQQEGHGVPQLVVDRQLYFTGRWGERHAGDDQQRQTQRQPGAGGIAWADRQHQACSRAMAR